MAAQAERERTYCAEYAKQHDVLVNVEEQELFTEQGQELATHPKVRERNYRLF